MQTYLSALIFCLISTSAIALPCHDVQNLQPGSVCGSVQPSQKNQNIYVVLNPQNFFADGSTAQIPFYASKNKICKELLRSEGLASDATYVRGTLSTFSRAVRNTALPTIATLECKINSP